MQVPVPPPDPPSPTNRTLCLIGGVLRESAYISQSGGGEISIVGRGRLVHLEDTGARGIWGLGDRETRCSYPPPANAVKSGLPLGVLVLQYPTAPPIMASAGAKVEGEEVNSFFGH